MVKAGENRDMPLTPRAADYTSGDSPAAKAACKRSRTMQLGVCAFFALNIIVLYVLHFVDRGASSSNDSKLVTGEFKSDGVSSLSQKAAQDLVVSFAPDGKLRVGAGTTAYLDATSLPEDKSLAYLTMAPMGTSKALYNANLLAYQQGKAPAIETVVTTFKGDLTAKTVAIADAKDSNVIKGESIKALLTLSDKLAVVVTTVTAKDGLTATPYVTAAKIDGESVELLQDTKTKAVDNSATNFVTRVSDTEFAHVFYEPYDATKPYNQRVQVGRVDDKGKTTVSTSLVFGSPNSNDAQTTVGQPQGIFKSNDRFTVPWFAEPGFNAAANATKATEGLCLSTFSYDAKNANVSSIGEVCETRYQPKYFLDMAKVKDNVVALVFVDQNNRFALTVVMVEFSELSGKPTFRGSYVFTEATGAFDFGAAFGFYPKPTLQVLSNQRLAVAFMNPSNTGKPSVTVLKFGSDLSLQSVSPVLPISNGDFSLASADPKASGGIVINVLALESGFVAGYAGLWSGKQHQRLSFVESFGRPVGVVADVDGSDEVSISVSGTIQLSGVSDLKAGTAYFAATNGNVYVPSTATDDSYVLANDNKFVISKDALVGVAVSNDKLFVSPYAL